ncbi:uncharacterized protein LOC111705564 [Eurytemora carolleeae]|uniref:uncharacterized protein LOC111705564 n=1 Tax=Eurytemora carolleeae TaxID=1294199 RepID=UPI000C769B99|nr:uncharacterized protein LOC111705564 [Eurytemora carolleeae]|eukprot:XP_023333920.1 uncharacterized protein LOC111705564 [Eurytemora affinis]
MGSGPSKETSVEEFRTSDHVLSKGQHIITALVDDAPTVKKEVPEDKPTGPKKSTSFLSRAFGRSNSEAKRKIVDLDSSESETDTDDFEESKRGIDLTLRNDIEDLESTFDRLGLDERGRAVPQNGVNGGHHQLNNGGHHQLINGGHHKNNGGHSFDNDHMFSHGGHQQQFRNGLAENDEDTGGASLNNTSKTLLMNGKRMMSKKGNVRLSWNDRPYPEQEDSWTLSKVKIDGFDPEKFRVANSTSNPRSQQRQDKHSLLLIQNPSNMSYSEADMPGSVPAYDPTEQQLLASIEREMGVLY